MACNLTEETRIISNNTILSGHLSGLGDSATFQYTMIENETVTFTINLFNGLSTGWNATLKLYSIVGEELILIGTSFLRQPRNVIEHSSIIGDYFFCIESVYLTDYDVELLYTDYDGVAFVDCTAFSGEVVEDFELPEDEPPGCIASVLYNIIGGTLPLGLQMTTTGLIYGAPEEQDLTTKDVDPPSFTWHTTQTNGETSYYKVYDILVRAWLREYSESYVDTHFQVCVYNNWTLDNIPFMSSVDNFEQLIFECKEA